MMEPKVMATLFWVLRLIPAALYDNMIDFKNPFFHSTNRSPCFQQRIPDSQIQRHLLTLAQKTGFKSCWTALESRTSRSPPHHSPQLHPSPSGHPGRGRVDAGRASTRTEQWDWSGMKRVGGIGEGWKYTLMGMGDRLWRSLEHQECHSGLPAARVPTCT